MKRKISRLNWLAALCLCTLLAGPCGAGDRGERQKIVCDGLTGTTGLVMDSRGYSYTADSATGCILCLTPDGERLVHARVAGEPTALAVDSLRTLFVGTASGCIYAVTLDGSVSLVHTCKTKVTGLDLDRDGSLLIGTAGGEILRLARADFRFEQ